MRTFLIATTALFLATQAARADAIYQWNALSGPGDATGQLDITDAGYSAGSANFSYSNPTGDPGDFPPPSDIVSFSFSLYGSQEGNFIWRSSPFDGNYGIDLTVSGDGLAGGISSTNDGSTIEMSGSADLWTIRLATTDENSPCFENGNPECSGQTGEWMLVSGPSSSVPEPMSVAALALGLLGMGIVRRRA